MKKLLFLVLLFVVKSHSQFNASLPLIAPEEDCISAMRICDATQEYSFQLSSWGNIDDANGQMNIPGLSQSDFTRFESRVCWLKFTPQYSGQFGLQVCVHTNEELQYEIFTNPNCSNIEQGLYNLVNTNMLNGPTNCSGYGIENPNNISGNFFLPYINLTAGNTYVFLILTRFINQTGTHRFTLKFTGQLVTDHPDVFYHPDCNLATEEVIAIDTLVSVYPNPFTDSFTINSTLPFEKIILYDILGKQIHKQNFANEIVVKNLSQGVYFLHLFDNEGNKVVKKLVKE